MIKEITLLLSPKEAADDALVKKRIAEAFPGKSSQISGHTILKRSIDARGKRLQVRLVIEVFIGETPQKRTLDSFHFQNVQNAPKSVIIIGTGPAGLFAALRLLELGIKPILLERGKNVRSRRRDLAALNKQGILNPDSNYCFGEGGAGTYSDGKLYTRSTKRGNIDRILQRFVHFGAGENILFEAHPHIGTNKLPEIITSIRNAIEQCGGSVLFDKKVCDLRIKNDRIEAVMTEDGNSFSADAYLLATGHSARDIFELLARKKITIEAKPFALGVRVEHPQEIIDNLQYHDPEARQWLPPASYSLVHQSNGRGVFSFCMCPGGIIAPASTSPEELVVNGWSPSKRNNPFANSGMVVQVTAEDAFLATKSLKTDPADPLLFLHFQKMVEKKSFEAGGGKFVAPAQRMVDFTERRFSSSLPSCSYIPGVNSADLSAVLPNFIYDCLRDGFKAFGKKMHRKGLGFLTNEAIVVATESRTSSPVRIPRDKEKLSHPQLPNFYPCGEGAGYAGGIMSAAIDGEKVAEKIAQQLTGIV